MWVADDRGARGVEKLAGLVTQKGLQLHAELLQTPTRPIAVIWAFMPDGRIWLNTYTGVAGR